MAINLYLRVSTLDQSFDQQMQDIKAYFNANRLNIDDVANVIEEHVSGGKSYEDRKFQQLLHKCRPGDYIYAASTDRLGRNFIDMMKLMEDAKKRGVIIVACKQNLSLDDDNSMAKIVLAVTAIMDEDERKRIKHRTANKKAWQREQIAKHGYFIIENGPNKGEKCTYVGSRKGHDTSKARKASILAKQDTVIAWRERSMAVRFALRKRAEGWTLQRIVDEIGQLYDDEQSKNASQGLEKQANQWGTPTGKKPSKGTISLWVRESNPLSF